MVEGRREAIRYWQHRFRVITLFPINTIPVHCVRTEDRCDGGGGSMSPCPQKPKVLVRPAVPGSVYQRVYPYSAAVLVHAFTPIITAVN